MFTIRTDVLKWILMKNLFIMSILVPWIYFTKFSHYIRETQSYSEILSTDFVDINKILSSNASYIFTMSVLIFWILNKHQFLFRGYNRIRRNAQRFKKASVLISWICSSNTTWIQENVSPYFLDEYVVTQLAFQENVCPYFIDIQ